eukprot:1257203-Prorocentrum_lima.AAC.1
MTSSLVGSEMCIRDSVDKAHVTEGTPATVTLLDIWGCAEMNQAQKPKIPVSYTHLTLPTICSV